MKWLRKSTNEDVLDTANRYRDAGRAHLAKGADMSASGNDAMAQFEFSRAIENFSQAIALAPTFVGAMVERADAYRARSQSEFHLGESEAALLSVVNAIAELSAVAVALPGNIAVLARRAEALSERAAIELAIGFDGLVPATLREALADYDTIARDPDSDGLEGFRSLVRFRLGEVEQQLGNLEIALNEFSLALDDMDVACKDGGSDLHHLLSHGWMYMAKSDLLWELDRETESCIWYERAASEYLKAIALDPTNERALTNRAVALEKVSRINLVAGNLSVAKEQAIESISDSSRLLAAMPDDILAKVNHGLALSTLANIEHALGNKAGTNSAISGALDDFNSVLSVEPGRSSALRNRGYVYLKIAEIAISRGELHLVGNACNRAAADFDAVLKMDPGDRGILLDRQRVKEFQEQFSESNGMRSSA